MVIISTELGIVYPLNIIDRKQNKNKTRNDGK